MGVDILMKTERKGASKRKLVLVTNFKAEIEIDQEFIDSLVGNMKLHKIALEVSL